MGSVARRVMLSLMTVGAVASLVVSTSFALFKGEAAAQDATFAAGTVDLAAPSSTAISVGPLAPGDAGTAGTYRIQYTGNLSAWVGLDVGLVSTAARAGAPGSGTGTQALVNDGPNSLQLTIRDSASAAYTLGTIACVPGTSGASPTKTSCRSSAPDQVVGGQPVGSGWSDTFTVTYSFPLGAGNDYQGSTASLTLTAHAVQAANNPGTPGASAPTSW